ncbi:MAG: hypothetical protein ABI761_05015 [Saprospiraceae bacterium]
MIRVILFGYLLLSVFIASAQLTYKLIYNDSTSSKLNIQIQSETLWTAPICFIMPRSVPGTYSVTLYDHFIENLYAIDEMGKKHKMVKDENDAPRWYYSDTGTMIKSITYEVQVDNMEKKLPPADASAIRSDFAGILNYSVFGWIEGTENEHVQCTVETFTGWPIFTTTHPDARPKGHTTFKTANYYSLADAQIFMGPGFKVKEFKGIVPLYIVSYSQNDEQFLDDYGKQGIASLGILNNYFGEIPFTHYSILLRNVIPLLPGHYGAFGMEHLQSSTFFGDTSGLRKGPMSEDDVIRTMPTFLHHMGHAFIPLRSYGDTYLPHVLEIPPVINTIWFNEGFMWFLPYDTLRLDRMKKNFNKSVYSTSPLIKKMSLFQLSQTASTMYALDFRLGRAVYSRGALMALEMNEYIKKKSFGKKSMKEVFQYFYLWAKKNNRAFTIEEFPVLLNKACNIDLKPIYTKWQLPVD